MPSVLLLRCTVCSHAPCERDTHHAVYMNDVNSCLIPMSPQLPPPMSQPQVLGSVSFRKDRFYTVVVTVQRTASEKADFPALVLGDIMCVNPTELNISECQRSCVGESKTFLY